MLGKFPVSNHLLLCYPLGLSLYLTFISFKEIKSSRMVQGFINSVRNILSCLFNFLSKNRNRKKEKLATPQIKQIQHPQ